MGGFRADNFADTVMIKEMTNIGELAVGGTSDVQKVILSALANMNDPYINEVLLAYKVNFLDRITKTRVFPRIGMALPNGEVYKEEPNQEELELPSE